MRRYRLYFFDERRRSVQATHELEAAEDSAAIAAAQALFDRHPEHALAELWLIYRLVRTWRRAPARR